MSSGETKFSVMCSLFNWMQKSKSSAKKRSKFRKFLDNFCKSSDYFSAIRLILPSLDRERGSYGLKESVLATCLIDALGMSRDSKDALRLLNWRKGGAKTGANAGNFSLVAAEVRFSTTTFFHGQSSSLQENLSKTLYLGRSSDGEGKNARQSRFSSNKGINFGS